MTQKPAGCGWVLLWLVVAGWLLVLAGCSSLGCRSTWFRRCTPLPAGTVDDCAKGSLARPELYPELPYWSQGQTPEGWTAAVNACRSCMMTGDSAAACSRRMWGR